MAKEDLPGTGGLLVHEWIERSGGAEKVLDVFHAMAPGADIFCLWDDAPERFPGTTVMESWLAASPLRHRKAMVMPLMSRAMRRPPVPDPEWALVSSHSFAHHFASSRGSRRFPTFVYAHTPPRYLWAPEVDPRAASVGVRVLGPTFRAVDRRYAGTGADYAVNSRYVAERARRAWRLDPVVIHPPVDVARVRSAMSAPLSEPEAEVVEGLPDSFLLGASRFVPYKRLDLVIDLAEELNVPAVVVGSGPEEAALRRRAAESRVPVIFLIHPSDTVLFRLFARALAFVFPPVEDFGIMPVEALVAGARIVVNAQGGAGEIVARLGGGVTHDFRPGGAQEALTRALDTALPTPDEVERHLGAARFATEVRTWMAAEGVDLASSAAADRPVG